MNNAKAPIEERRDFFRYSHAANSFWVAANLFEELKKGLETMPKWKRYSTWGSLATCYFRPFAQKPKAIWAINENVVPSHLKHCHNQLRDMRNKVFAHTQEDFEETAGFPLNTVVLRVDGNKPEMGFGFPFPSNTQGFCGELIEFMRDHTEKKAAAIWNKWAPHLHPGEQQHWKLNIGKNSDDIFLPDQR